MSRGEDDRDPRDAGSDEEDRGRRLDRELIELLNELRVVLPGVQVLFAFLLTVPFSGRFARLTDVQQGTYFTAFLFTGVATVLLMTPTAYHRIRWREFDKERMLQTSNRLALGGLAFIALALCSVVFLITDLVISVPAALAISSLAAVVIVWLWAGLPLSRKLRDRPGA